MNRPVAIILYGPPASGKDTVTQALISLSPDYALFQRLKVGAGRTTGYRRGTAHQLDRLRADDGILYENQRYGNIYVVDRSQLDLMIATGHVPIVHLGQAAGIDALRNYPAKWITILLWCSRPETVRRLTARGDADAAARLRVWEETREDLRGTRAGLFDLIFRTDRDGPAEVASSVHRVIADGAASE